MKENTETINDLIFTHCPSGYTKGNPLCLLLNCLKKQVISFKDQLQFGAAALGIGFVFLVTAYLFFIQLAEYGWQ